MCQNFYRVLVDSGYGLQVADAWRPKLLGNILESPLNTVLIRGIEHAIGFLRLSIASSGTSLECRFQDFLAIIYHPGLLTANFYAWKWVRAKVMPRYPDR